MTDHPGKAVLTGKYCVHALSGVGLSWIIAPRSAETVVTGQPHVYEIHEYTEYTNTRNAVLDVNTTVIDEMNIHTYSDMTYM